MPRNVQPPKSLRSDARALLASCPGAVARLAARRISGELDRALAASGVSAAQLALLAQIAAAEDDTLGALAQRSGLEQSSLSRNLQVLDKAGLIEIATVEQDRRRRAVWLTEAGARRLEAALPIWRKAQARLTRTVPQALIGRLAEAIRRIRQD
jgi:DNA-binding MarR family transcriptional regulator